MLRSNVYKECAVYLALVLVALIISLVVFLRFDINLSLPLNYKGDAVIHYNFVKNIADSGSYAVNYRYGAPGIQELYDHPVNDGLQLFLVKVLLVFGLNWVMAGNFFYLITFPLTAVISYFVMRLLHIRRGLSFSLSLAYAFLPYHFFRGVDHLFLSAYFMLPLGVLLAYKFANAETPAKKYLIILAIILGSSGAYYAFMSIYIVFVGFLIGFFGDGHSSNKKKTLTASFFMFVFVTGLMFIINLYPSLKFAYDNGKNYNAIVRNPRDAEIYGLKIIQLLLPVEDHNVSFMNKLTKRYVTYAHQSTFNENQYSSLGLTASVGFLILLFGLIIAYKSDVTLRILASLNIALILLGTIGGFNSIISYYASPLFRSLNRVSILIAFISLVALGHILSRIKINKIVYSALVLGIVPFALFDQISLGTMRNFQTDPVYFMQLKDFVLEVEQELGQGSKVFTLPFGEYPEGNEKDMIKAALLSENLYWSTGAGKWRDSNYWQYRVSQLPVEQMLSAVAARGFSGLIIRNTEETKNTTTALADILGEPYKTFRNEFIFYNLQGYIEANDIQIAHPQTSYYVSGGCVNDYSEAGKTITTYWCTDPVLIITKNFTDYDLAAIFDLDISYADGSTETHKQEFILKPGKNKLKFNLEDRGVFSRPGDNVEWPFILGYPKYAITQVNLAETYKR